MARRFTSLAVAALTLLALLGVSRAAEARVVATSPTSFVAGPALASDGRLVVGERTLGGAVNAVAIDPTGARARRTLATFPAAPLGSFTTLGLTGTGGVVGAQVNAEIFNDPRTGGTRLLSSRGQTLLPASAIGVCASLSGYAPGVRVAGGTAFAATLGADCGPIAGPIRVHRAGAVRTLPVAADAQTSGLRAVGDYVAWAEVTPGSPPGHAVVLARASTGELLVRAPVAGFGAEALGLGSDGTLAWVEAARPEAGCRAKLYVASADRPQPLAISGPGTPCPFAANAFSDRGSIAIAGGLVVYPSSPGFAVTDGSGAGRLVGAFYGGESLAFDGRTIYGLRDGCAADSLVAVDVLSPAAATAPIPLLSPYGTDCPVRRVGSARLRASATGRVAIRLRCPDGCHGIVRIVQQRGFRQRLAGRVTLTGRGAVTARVRLARYAANLAACGSGLRLRAQLQRRAPRSLTLAPAPTMELGILRVRSAGRCRHTAGPAFERQVRAP